MSIIQLILLSLQSNIELFGQLYLFCSLTLSIQDFFQLFSHRNTIDNTCQLLGQHFKSIYQKDYINKYMSRQDQKAPQKSASQDEEKNQQSEIGKTIKEQMETMQTQIMSQLAIHQETQSQTIMQIRDNQGALNNKIDAQFQLMSGLVKNQNNHSEIMNQILENQDRFEDKMGRLENKMGRLENKMDRLQNQIKVISDRQDIQGQAINQITEMTEVQREINQIAIRIIKGQQNMGDCLQRIQGILNSKDNIGEQKE